MSSSFYFYSLNIFFLYIIYKIVSATKSKLRTKTHKGVINTVNNRIKKKKNIGKNVVCIQIEPQNDVIFQTAKEWGGKG